MNNTIKVDLIFENRLMSSLSISSNIPFPEVGDFVFNNGSSYTIVAKGYNTSDSSICYMVVKSETVTSQKLSEWRKRNFNGPN